MATIDEDLGQIERDIRQLKIEYDQFFGGGRKRPPTEIEWRIDLLMKKYSERGGDLKSAQRFRFTNLSQTYAKYKDIFRKKVKQKEEGTVQRHFGAAAKAIEAERALRAMETEALAAGNGAEPAEKHNSPGRAFRMSCSDPDRDSEKVAKLYQALISAKQSTGEEIGKLTPESFAEFVRKKTKHLRQEKNCKEVEYVVEVVGGQAKLKALVKA
ncbi:MAG TPA: MXAN_5187 C-terminal domain-containing protein [Candidatus Acidoferrum sp.]|jgi:hypothetical protein|nr:MXAN_5187 C-terminal domain-containing protein [Candidatus Acidoferrum sp.]